MQIGGGNKMDVSDRVGKKFIDARHDINSFWIDLSSNKIWNNEFVHRARENKIFQAPLLLILKGFKSDFRCWSAFSEEDVLFQDALTSISAHSKNESKELKVISGILHSKLFSYINLQTFSSSGIEREQAHNIEKFSLPYVYNKDIERTVEELIQIKKRNYSFETLLDDGLLEKIKQKEIELDNEVIYSFHLSSQEKDLVDYSNQIIIPMLMKHNGFEKIFNSLPKVSQELNDYVNLFLERFKESFKKNNQTLVVEIYHTNQIIGLFFKLVSIKEKVEPISYVQTNNDEVLKSLAALGNEKITDRLFIQKDIRGFEKEGFYIVKPNEKRLWHKAIGHLDVNEFTDAILTAGKKHTFNVR